MLNLSLRQCYFDAIKAGKKTVEGRLYGDKYKDIAPGLSISFTCNNTNEVIICIVDAVNIYENFYDMLDHEGFHKMLPGIASIEDGVAIYESFPGYKDGVVKNGAVAIRIRVLIS